MTDIAEFIDVANGSRVGTVALVGRGASRAAGGDLGDRPALATRPCRRWRHNVKWLYFDSKLVKQVRNSSITAMPPPQKYTAIRETCQAPPPPNTCHIIQIVRAEALPSADTRKHQEQMLRCTVPQGYRIK